jgi:hypothetical protein
VFLRRARDAEPSPAGREAAGILSRKITGEARKSIASRWWRELEARASPTGRDACATICCSRSETNGPVDDARAGLKQNLSGLLGESNLKNSRFYVKALLVLNHLSVINGV